ncbi:uncharacterized protein LOC144132515 isoform X7 [Amblyomma americanum]
MRPHMNLWGAERMMTAACSATFLVSLDTLFHPVQKSSACSRAVWQMQSHWHRGDRTHATLRYPSELVPAVAPAVKCPETSIWNPACYLVRRPCHKAWLNVVLRLEDFSQLPAYAKIKKHKNKPCIT